MARSKQADNMLMVIAVAILVLIGFLIYKGDQAGKLQYTALASGGLTLLTVIVTQLLKEPKDDRTGGDDDDVSRDGGSDVTH